VFPETFSGETLARFLSWSSSSMMFLDRRSGTDEAVEADYLLDYRTIGSIAAWVWCFRHQVLLGGQSRSSSGKGDRPSRVEEHE
jgi:hypothetical protein